VDFKVSSSCGGVDPKKTASAAKASVVGRVDAVKAGVNKAPGYEQHMRKHDRNTTLVSVVGRVDAVKAGENKATVRTIHNT